MGQQSLKIELMCAGVQTIPCTGYTLQKTKLKWFIYKKIV